MDHAYAILAVVAGLVLLVKAGDVLVVHAVALATGYRLPKVVIGAIILGFGTSLPELGVSLDSAIRGQPVFALGNVVGSNIANVGLILGIGALLTSLRVERRVIRSDLPFGVLAALFLLLWVGPAGQVSRTAGVILLTAFVLYLWSSLRYTRNYQGALVQEASAKPKPLRHSLFILLGLVGIGLGAEGLVWGARTIAEDFGVSKRVIGVGMMAVGTSLPELATTLAAARKGEADLAVGNIAGSNLFNLLFVLGTTAVIRPIPVESAMVAVDFPVMVVFAVLAFPLLVADRRIGRRQGIILLAAYAVYITNLWFFPPHE